MREAARNSEIAKPFILPYLTMRDVPVEPLPPLNRLAIDHVVHTSDMRLSDVELRPEYGERASKLSQRLVIHRTVADDRMAWDYPASFRLSICCGWR
jgi:hypothetical protein